MSANSNKATCSLFPYGCGWIARLVAGATPIHWPHHTNKAKAYDNAWLSGQHQNRQRAHVYPALAAQPVQGMLSRVPGATLLDPSESQPSITFSLRCTNRYVVSALELCYESRARLVVPFYFLQCFLLRSVSRGVKTLRRIVGAIWHTAVNKRDVSVIAWGIDLPLFSSVAWHLIDRS